MEVFFADINVPYGQKLKDVWSKIGIESMKTELAPGNGRGGGGAGGAGGGGEEEGVRPDADNPSDVEKPKMPAGEMRWKWLDILRSHDVDRIFLSHTSLPPLSHTPPTPLSHVSTTSLPPPSSGFCFDFIKICCQDATCAGRDLSPAFNPSKQGLRYV
jgi:hypothetical protein